MISFKHIVHCYYYRLKRQHGSNKVVYVLTFLQIDSMVQNKQSISQYIFVLRSLVSQLLLNLKVS